MEQTVHKISRQLHDIIQRAFEEQNHSTQCASKQSRHEGTDFSNCCCFSVYFLVICFRNRLKSKRTSLAYRPDNNTVQRSSVRQCLWSMNNKCDHRQGGIANVHWRKSLAMRGMCAQNLDYRPHR